MVFPGPATTFSLPLYVAQKKGWLGDLEVEEVNVTATPMRPACSFPAMPMSLSSAW